MDIKTAKARVKSPGERNAATSGGVDGKGLPRGLMVPAKEMSMHRPDGTP